MKAYGQYCPIAKGAEIFAERWTPLVVRNLKVGCTTFNQILAGAPGMPRSVLSNRLRQLERSGVVERRLSGRRVTYHLTRSGEELADVCYALGVWGARWLEHTPSPLDAYLALWYFARLVDRSALPPHRVTVRVDLVDTSRPDRYWVLLDRSETEVCATPPGYPEDLVLTTDAEWLVRWHTGRVSLAAARRAGGIRMQGPRHLIRDFARWGGLSPFAQVAGPRSQ
ncbi:MAG TPA: helix-turn-helix domain-containing protein [Micromonosporaceae bacterium]|nr:helix-turn-helix domain-containing protein [Micromonosporaceae bacterium]